ncbi:unnamed protein product [Caenorhabditis angaria]|uniref:Uncharacterized protein n=1 Tax=Caenorhabditis angaria TaxID=860376 RepID=A0A9P1IYG1_9PELO|nr:unnamed protein product [Caenorhabditis angaria]
MTRPTAPILTADYYTYSTYSQREDFYGGFEPKNESNNSGMGYHPNAGPARMEPVICKNKSRKDVREDTISAHCIAFIYLILAFIILAFNAYLYVYGVRNKAVVYLSGVMGFVVLTSLMMHIGIARRQPFLCIPFVVCRTMEAFTCICFTIAFGYALVDPRSEFFKFFHLCTKFILSLLPKFNIDVVDATTQLCIVGFVFFLLLLAISIYVCRISFECTMWVADQLRAKRMQQTYDSSRVRIASDEFYCS